MQFTHLLTRAGIEALEVHQDAAVGHVASDSRQVRPGSCFIAIRGPQADGHGFIAQAVAAGATAIVCEEPAGLPSSVAWARVADSAAAAGPLAQAALDWPARKLTLVAVTGTKGKTTFTYLARHILHAAGHSAGLIGTIRHEWPGGAVAAGNTTPGAVELAELMARMVAAGATHAVMEVSSHALDQRRTAGLDFAAAAFTNLSGEHLDYHRTMDEYLLAKRRLFESLAGSAVAVLNRDDHASEAVAAATPARLLWYGLNSAADLNARIERIGASGTAFRLSCGGQSVAVDSRLLGRHNVANCLAAAGACLALGVELPVIGRALSEPIHVPGRLQRVPSAAPFEVLVDYAHTDDALDNALAAVRPLTSGRLIVMFGCGGDRDRTKRPRMAKVAAARADAVIVTSDNPRTEPPLKIIDDIVAGFGEADQAKVTVEPDRRLAIERAIEAAEAGDVVVLAGKGHEDYQVIGKTKHHFDDAEVAAAALARRFGAAEGSA